MLAGILLDDDDMSHVDDYEFAPIEFLGGSEPITDPFAEDQTIFYVSQREVDASHSAAWNPDDRDTEEHMYETTDIGLPEWGIVGQTNPEFSNNFWNTAYRRCWSIGTFIPHLPNISKHEREASGCQGGQGDLECREQGRGGRF